MHVSRVVPALLLLIDVHACSGDRGGPTPPQVTCTNFPAATAPAPVSLWTQIQPSGSLPPARVRHAAAYDSTNDRLIIFGGSGASGVLNDLWVLSNATGTRGAAAWTQLNPAGPPPAARYSARVAYDAATGRLILFGGADANNHILSDYWVLTNASGLSGTPQWIQAAALNSPSTRGLLASDYDGRNARLILFGGESCGTTTCALFSDTYAAASATNTAGSPSFAHLAPSGTLPPPRYDSGVAYDAADNRMVIFGGQTSTGVTNDPFGRVNDSWSLSNANGLGGSPAWTQLNASGGSPAARESHSTIWDAVRSHVVAYAGLGTDNVTRNDVWTLSAAVGGATASWSRYAPASSPAPIARYGHAALYAGPFAQMVVFGGAAGGSTLLNDVWTLKLAAPTGAAIAIRASISTVCVGNTVQLVAVVTDSSGNAVDLPVTWSSSNSSVATVDSAGNVTGTGQGSADIIATVPGQAQLTAQQAIAIKPNPGQTGVVTVSTTLTIPLPQTQTGCQDTNGNISTNVTATTLVAWGGAPSPGYTWHVSSGSFLPPGFSLQPLTGIVTWSGGLLLPGNSTTIITVSDCFHSSSSNIGFQVVTASSADVDGIPGVGCPSAQFQQGNAGMIALPNAKLGAAYGASIYVTVGSIGTQGAAAVTPLTWTLAGGSLPSGLLIDQGRGIVRGTVNSSAAAGVYTFTISVRDSQGKIATGAPLQYTITVP